LCDKFYKMKKLNKFRRDPIIIFINFRVIDMQVLDNKINYVERKH